MNRCYAAVVVAAVLGFAMLQPRPASAGNLPNSFSVTPFAGGYVFEGNQRQNMPIYGLSLGYNFTPNWTVELTGSVIPDSVMRINDAFGTPSLNRWNAYGVRGDLLYHFLPQELFVPYLAIGGGAIFLDSDQASSLNETAVGYGGGLKYFLNDSIALRLDVRHLLVLDSNTTTRDIDNNFAYTAGVTFQLGGVRPSRAVVVQAEDVRSAPPVFKPAAAPAGEQAPAEPVPVPAPAPAPVVEPVPAPAPEEPLSWSGQDQHPAALPGEVLVTGIAIQKDSLEIMASERIGAYKTFTLSQPSRLVIDISGGVNSIGTKRIPVRMLGITAVRFGNHPDFLRVVLDAAQGKLLPYRIEETGKGLKIIIKEQ